MQIGDWIILIGMLVTWIGGGLAVLVPYLLAEYKAWHRTNKKKPKYNRK